jgi:hypothetical protein
MRIKAEELVTTKKVVLQRIECDKCGLSDITPEGIYDVYEFELAIKVGEHYPEGRHVTLTTCDLCSTCAKDLQVLLVNNGYRLTTTND